jgi:cytochrome b pre-mRNA-processing protein 3
VLVLRRLSSEPEAAQALGQRVFDTFARDIENQLREFGLGDHTVPKEMRAIVESFYGRLKAYDSALAEAGDAALEAALGRNLHAGEVADPAWLPHLARYVRAAAAHLAAQPASAFAAGEITFPDPSGCQGGNND